MAMLPGRIVCLVVCALSLVGCGAPRAERVATNAAPGRNTFNAPGAAPSATPPTAPTARLPKKEQLTYADRQAWRELVHWSDDCEQAYEATFGRDEAHMQFFALPDRKYLGEVSCAAGAYQGSQVYFWLDETEPQPRLLQYQTYESPDENTLGAAQQTPELWGLADFAAQTQTLTVFNRFRGPGDCGTRAVYSFAAGQAQLTELRAKLKCDGRGAEHPERWPRMTPR